MNKDRSGWSSWGRGSSQLSYLYGLSHGDQSLNSTHTVVGQSFNSNVGSNPSGLSLPRVQTEPSTKPELQLPSIPNPSFLFVSPSRPHGHRNPTNYKKLTNAELQLKIEKALYFRCDAKFSSSHRCKNNQLQVSIVQGDPS